MEERLSRLPAKAQKILLGRYLAISNKQTRNIYLREQVDNLLEKLTVSPEKLNLNITEEELNEEAETLAESTLAIRRTLEGADGEIDDALNTLCESYGIQAPDPEQYSRVGRLARLSDKSWWLRKLRKALRKNIETALRHLNQVNRRKGIYCSDETLSARASQKYHQEQYLSNTIVTNQHGQSFSLLELSKKGVSDPKIRKTELMVRARGFEDLANELGHTATFLTFTCPSKYHRSYATTGDENPKWGGYTPAEAQAYLNDIWKLIRARLQREDVRFYGFRVVEPQHDGTPHWHLLLFVQPSHYDTMISVMREYAMREDADENGAEQHRFTEVKIDPSKGSATGYIAKYISKNIDGENLDSGVYGEDPKCAAARVEAWAACWGIRQFQQLGGCSVTVWRELRRLKAMMGESQLLKDIFEAADKGCWKTFTALMGGVFCKRTEQAISPHYELSVDTATGVVKTSMYSEEELIKVLKGIASGGQTIITRLNEWHLS
ncbi:replication endonuclease [Veronia nyctiphanis]|uniref:replication endonuclease n=1 Tax=Veronia nyctiphanis TaxID=1278244 RepID=UPI001F169CBB|nr:replication endonuclease [Veronia nyctiphanis]